MPAWRDARLSALVVVAGRQIVVHRVVLALPPHRHLRKLRWIMTR